MSLEGDCRDCVNRVSCLTIPVVPIDIEMNITQNGTASTDWWSKEAAEILSALGPPAPGYEEVNQNPWCG